MSVVPVPVPELPFPAVEFSAGAGDPIAAIVTSPEYKQAAISLEREPLFERSLVGTGTQSLLYALIRNRRPLHVFEIGTYRGGTTEVMARALCANGTGMLHTVGPFDESHFMPVYQQWHPDLQKVVRFHPLDSMAFFMRMEAEDIRPDLVMVDGNHDYEFVSFDIHSAARLLLPGGFIVLDAISQSGPFLAALDFLDNNAGWVDCGLDRLSRDRTKSFDPQRTTIPGTDSAVLRAPSDYPIGARPHSFGEIPWRSSEARGFTLIFASPPGSGQLNVQCILRGFGTDHIAQFATGTSVMITPAVASQQSITILFDKPLKIESGLPRYSLEPWFVWTGKEPLRLSVAPAMF